MATGRTVAKYARIYVGKIQADPGLYPAALCGFTRSLGPIKVSFDEIDATGMCDSIKGYLPGQASINPGPINVILDPVAADVGGLYMYPQASGMGIGTPLLAQIPIGIRAAPAMGDIVFGGIFPFLGMTYSDDGGLVTVNFDLGDSVATEYISDGFGKAWGQLLHAYGEETAANSSAGVDGGAASTNGGLMILHTFSSDSAGATYKVQHADTNVDGSFADLTGAAITIGAGPAAYSYYAYVPKNTAVKRYLRWQMTAITNTFLMSFIRG